jgi:hypothetical protein
MKQCAGETACAAAVRPKFRQYGRAMHQNNPTPKTEICRDIQKLPTQPRTGNNASAAGHCSWISADWQAHIFLGQNCLKNRVLAKILKVFSKFSRFFSIQLNFEHACCYITHKISSALAENRGGLRRESRRSVSDLNATDSDTAVKIPQG